MERSADDEPGLAWLAHVIVCALVMVIIAWPILSFFFFFKEEEEEIRKNLRKIEFPFHCTAKETTI